MEIVDKFHNSNATNVAVVDIYHSSIATNIVIVDRFQKTDDSCHKSY